ncbi:MAG: hypothetical protein ACYDGR_05435, partial [Candidatus Dormibacteria bacterium]
AEPDPEPEPQPEPEPEPVRAAGSSAPKRRRQDLVPDVRPPETMQLYPVPLGRLVYEALSTGFVDFPKLLRSLSKEDHTGYVRLSSADFSGVLLFSAGAVVEAIYDGHGVVVVGKDAFKQFGAHIDDGQGVLDVIALTPEMVTAIYQLMTGPSHYEKLLARFVKVDALVEHLQETGHSGALIVKRDEHEGVVLFREGAMLGTYTESSREVAEDTAKVLELCTEPHAQIEVRGGPVPQMLPVMDPGKGPAEVPSGSGQGSGPAPARSTANASTQAMPAAAVPDPPSADPEPEASPENDADEAVVDLPPVTADTDWAAILNRMAARADEVLGTRSKKVKEMLFATTPTREDVDETLDRISELSIMFVDPSKLTALADDMRQMAGAA